MTGRDRTAAAGLLAVAALVAGRYVAPARPR